MKHASNLFLEQTHQCFCHRLRQSALILATGEEVKLSGHADSECEVTLACGSKGPGGSVCVVLAHALHMA